MDPKSIASAVRAAVWSADGEVPVPQERTLEQLMSESVARRRFQMMLVVLFAGAALALAAFGTYGVVSYAVARRRAEIGIRMALGAGQGRVLRLVLRQGMMPVLAGLAGGAVAAMGIGELRVEPAVRSESARSGSVRTDSGSVAGRIGARLLDSGAARSGA
ncbi:MAG: FtsX-like permease family protein [Ignavibacteriota bacterium]